MNDLKILYKVSYIINLMYKYRMSYNNDRFEMLDYYGSITMENDEINKIIMRYFESQMNQSAIMTMINKYRRLEFIEPEYSVSGWHMFHYKTVLDLLQDDIIIKKKKVEQFIKFVYSVEKNYNVPHDLYEMIYENY